MTALNIEIRTNSDFLTGKPPIFVADQSILQRPFRRLSTLLFLSQSVYGVNASAHDFNSGHHRQMTDLNTHHGSSQTWIPSNDVFYHIRQTYPPGISAKPRPVWARE